jgi:hypothetical protein
MVDSRTAGGMNLEHFSARKVRKCSENKLNEKHLIEVYQGHRSPPKE